MEPSCKHCFDIGVTIKKSNNGFEKTPCKKECEMSKTPIKNIYVIINYLFIKFNVSTKKDIEINKKTWDLSVKNMNNLIKHH